MFYYQLEHFFLRVNPANIWLDHPRREELDTLYSVLASLPAEKRVHDRRYVSFVETMIDWYIDQLQEGKTEKACSDIVRLFSKFSDEEVRTIARATFAEEMAAPFGTRKLGKHTVAKGIRYIKESVALLRELQHLGFDIWAISGSNVWSIQPVFERLGLPDNRIIGIDLLHSTSLLSSKVGTPVPVLEGKVEALRLRTDLPPTIVVSDSIYDLPLFGFSSELKVFVNSRMENSYSFFKQAQIEQDHTWVVIENPTIEQ